MNVCEQCCFKFYSFDCAPFWYVFACMSFCNERFCMQRETLARLTTPDGDWCSSAGSERSSRAGGDAGGRPPPPLPPPRFPNSAVWQWEGLNMAAFSILPLPAPLLTLEDHLVELISQRSKACATYLRHSFKRPHRNSTDWLFDRSVWYRVITKTVLYCTQKVPNGLNMLSNNAVRFS